MKIKTLVSEAGFVLAPSHRQTLIDHYTFLMEEMEAEGTLLDCLKQCEVLDEQELDEIRALTVRHERNAKLLDFILRTTSTQYDKFLEALRESRQERVYNKLHSKYGSYADYLPIAQRARQCAHVYLYVLCTY